MKIATSPFTYKGVLIFTSKKLGNLQGEIILKLSSIAKFGELYSHNHAQGITHFSRKARN